MIAVNIGWWERILGVFKRCRPLGKPRAWRPNGTTPARPFVNADGAVGSDPLTFHAANRQPVGAFGPTHGVHKLASLIADEPRGFYAPHGVVPTFHRGMGLDLPVPPAEERTSSERHVGAGVAAILSGFPSSLLGGTLSSAPLCPRLVKGRAGHG